MLALHVSRAVTVTHALDSQLSARCSGAQLQTGGSSPSSKTTWAAIVRLGTQDVVTSPYSQPPSTKHVRCLQAELTVLTELRLARAHCVLQVALVVNRDG